MKSFLRRLPARKIGVIVAVGALVMATLIAPLDRASQLVRLITGLAWPLTLLLALVFFWPQANALIDEVVRRTRSGSSVGLWGLSLGEAADRVQKPVAGQPITVENLALLHTSWLRADKTREFGDGRSYFQFEVVVIARPELMERIQTVTYHLEPPWTERTQVISDRAGRFKMKELANGTSIVTAEVRIAGNDEPIWLNRFIDLRPDGPRL